MSRSQAQEKRDHKAAMALVSAAVVLEVAFTDDPEAKGIARTLNQYADRLRQGLDTTPPPPQ